MIKVDNLIPYINNSRTHSDEQVSQIAASIKEFGFLNPVIIDEDNGLIAGHGRVMAAKKLGIDEIPFVVAEGLTEAQKKAYVIADNQLALNAGWDLEKLKLEVENLIELDFDTDLLGFEQEFIDDLLADCEPVEGLTDEDEVPEVPEIPVTVNGDVWLLGDHRLMCGDSTSIDAVERLIYKNEIDLVHTDPPYGINERCDREFTSTTSISKGGKFDQIIGDDSIETASDAFSLCQSLNIKRQVWWGANYYAHTVPQSNNWFVWDKRVEENQKNMNSDCELAWVKSKWSSVRIFRHLWKGLIKALENGQARVHPTQKPIALAEWVFDYYKDVKTVLDLFGGSGFNLIACEKTKRKCFIMELSEKYCDVIINRWQDFTGKEAIHADTGKTYNEMKRTKEAA